MNLRKFAHWTDDCNEFFVFLMLLMYYLWTFFYVIKCKVKVGTESNNTETNCLLSMLLVIFLMNFTDERKLLVISEIFKMLIFECRRWTFRTGKNCWQLINVACKVIWMFETICLCYFTIFVSQCLPLKDRGITLPHNMRLFLKIFVQLLYRKVHKQ